LRGLDVLSFGLLFLTFWLLRLRSGSADNRSGFKLLGGSAQRSAAQNLIRTHIIRYRDLFRVDLLKFAKSSHRSTNLGAVRVIIRTTVIGGLEE
jgi:hypothetical protein